MPTQTIACTVAEFQQLLATLPQEGCVLSDQTTSTRIVGGPPVTVLSGTVTNGGTVMTYAFNGSNLTVTAVSKTAWVPTWSQIFALLKTHLQPA